MFETSQLFEYAIYIAIAGSGVLYLFNETKGLGEYIKENNVFSPLNRYKIDK